MRNRLQTVLTVVLTLLFLASVPLVLLTTAGYRINLRTQRLEQTGILLVRSFPAGAEILLDGILQRERTPARLSRLLPRDYRVTVRKTGFREWSKLLDVVSQRSTFAETIVLFADRLPERVADAAARALSLSSDGTLAYDDTVGGMTEIRLRRPNGEETVATRVPRRTGGEPSLNLLWSPSGRTLAAFGDTATTLVGAAGTARVLDLASPHAAVWSGEDLFALSAADGRPYFVPEGGTPQPIASSTAAMLWQQNGLTYLGRATSSTVTVDVLAANGALLRPALFRMDPGWSSRFIPSPQGLLTVLDDERIRVFDATTGSPLLDRAARGALWRTDGTRELLVWTDFELWIVRPDGGADLLTRVGEPIRQAAWYPGGSHVLYATGTTLSALERDDRDGRIITALFSLPALGAFAVDENGAAIFAIAAPAGKPGVFRYPIVLP